MKERLLKYLNSDRHLWWTITIIPGVYSVLYLYTNNFTLVNSWYQLLFCMLAFVLLPVIGILVLEAVFKKWLPRWRPHLYWSFLIINFAIILSLTIYMGWRWKALILIAIIAIASSFFIAQHYKKVVLLVGFMVIIATGQFVLFYFERVATHEDWVQKMAFEDLRFQKRPNIYLIQPDGFVGKPAAENKNYQLDLNDFYTDLTLNGFLTNHDYRSNYPSTLTSNAALFTGQHHFFAFGDMENELYGARQVIVGKNPVLNTLESNGYTTNLILEHSYLLLNFPEISYDYCNILKEELSVPIPDYQLNKDFVGDFKTAVKNRDSKPQFFFLEILRPGHISVLEIGSMGKLEEAKSYNKKLHATKPILKDLILFINKEDPSAIVIIASDHGGFAGLDHTLQIYENPISETDIKQSMFSALLTIKAPNDFQSYNKNIKSSVGVFQNLFCYLAGNPVPLDTLDNSSYNFIKKGDARGVYIYFNTDGEPVTQKIKH